MPGKEGNLKKPHAGRVAQPLDEKERLSLSVLFEIDLDSIHSVKRHGGSFRLLLPKMTGGT
jgi:hypothetical protein